MLDPGDVINNRYKVIRKIGGGAFGTVYLVSDSSHFGAWRAMKEMMETDIPFGERQEAVELFAREVEILKSLNHPGLPRIFDSFKIGDSNYIVMEYIYGKTLEEMIKSRKGPYKWEDVLPWAEELCEILLYLHTRRPEPVIFRDLKPSNIIITLNVDVMLIDFGIARHYSRRKVRDTYFMGTPGFSPPEQYGRGQSDGRSDVFALGATMYRLLTKADMEQYSMKFPPLSRLSPSVPQWLERVIMKCLAVNTGERYQSVLPLLRDLRMRQFTSVDAGLLPAAVTMLLPNALVRMTSKMSSSLTSSQPAISLKNTMSIMAAAVMIIFGVTYGCLFGHINLSFVREYYFYYEYYGYCDYYLKVKYIILCCIGASFLYWSYKRGVHRFIVPAFHGIVAYLFSAHPVMKKILVVIHVSTVLALLSVIACNIVDGNDEWQDFINLRFSVIIFFVLLSVIHWISRLGIWRDVTVAAMICFLLSGVLAPNFLRARQQGCLSPCKSNLKNIGTTMEMYSSDYEGRYPPNLAAITPNYMRTLPTCSSAGRMSYRYVYTTSPDIYTIWCHGAYHTPMTSINLPEYDSIQGLHEK